MAVVARALVQNEFIVPVPLDLSPKSAKKQSTLVIVTVLDNPPDKQQLSKVYAYYGKENCQKIIGKMPHQLEDKVVICVPAFCLANSIYNLENKPVLESISPLWTTDKYGISSSEAKTLEKTTEKIAHEIHTKTKDVQQKLNKLKIQNDKKDVATIKKHERIIEKSQMILNKTKERMRWNSAEAVANFIRNNFEANVWIDNLIEPTVLFFVLPEVDDEKAVVIGQSIECVLNDIDPYKIEELFSDYIYDATVLPIVIDITFVEGTRTKSKDKYYQSS
jgi:hypothetical protein